ncbi:MAG: hypothetical protein ACI9F9_002063, partial [Candidatus Paceibacteria bacterium]
DGESWTPKLVIQLEVETLFMHCAKALLRSKLWAPESCIPRESFPTMGEILKDHLGHGGPAETREQMLERYAPDL